MVELADVEDGRLLDLWVAQPRPSRTRVVGILDKEHDVRHCLFAPTDRGADLVRLLERAEQGQGRRRPRCERVEVACDIAQVRLVAAAVLAAGHKVAGPEEGRVPGPGVTRLV